MDDLSTVRAAYASHLTQFPWDYYSTVTFRKLHRDPLNAASRVWGVLEKFGATRAFVAVERHRLDGVHVHTLHRHCFGTTASDASMWKYLYKAFGRTTIGAPRQADTAAIYCSKYVVKGDYSGDCFHYFGDAAAWNLDK